MHKDCKYNRITVEKEDTSSPDGGFLVDSKSGLSNMEPLFVFRAQDKLAPIALAAYIEALRAVDFTMDSESLSTNNQEMIAHVERHLEDFRAWTPRRLPD